MAVLLVNRVAQLHAMGAPCQHINPSTAVHLTNSLTSCTCSSNSSARLSSGTIEQPGAAASRGATCRTTANNVTQHTAQQQHWPTPVHKQLQSPSSQVLCMVGTCPAATPDKCCIIPAPSQIDCCCAASHLLPVTLRPHIQLDQQLCKCHLSLGHALRCNLPQRLNVGGKQLSTACRRPNTLQDNAAHNVSTHAVAL